MGNNLIPNTNVNKESIGNSGVNSQWQMYQGVRTDKTKDQVTVFLFDKKMISKMPSAAKEEFLTVLKREPQVLAKFKHQNILMVSNPLLEDAKRMGFATERIRGSLNNLIEKNMISEIFESELDVKLHILEIAETLSYLNREVKACHLAVSPENIYIMPDGKWKLGGFVFATQILQGDTCESKADFTPSGGHLKLTPPLRFTAPEVTSTPSICTFTSDMFSLGCLIYMLYKIRHDQNTNDPYLIKANSIHAYQDAVMGLNRVSYGYIPEEIRSVVMNMIHPDSSMRITATDFANHMWFKDPFVQTVKVLETIHQRDSTQQGNFLKGLNMIILKFEPTFIKTKIIPQLNLLLKNPPMASSVLPIYFKIMESQNPPILNREEFNTLLWPPIKTLVTGKEISAQALFVLIQQMQLFVGYLDPKEIEVVFVPILIKALECGVQKLQDLALKQTLVVFDKIDYAVLKAQILPKILNLCLDANIDLRKGAILMLSSAYHVFDSLIINEQILPTLEKLRKLNNNYAINMAMLTIFQGISKDIGTDVIANKVLVSLIPMLMVQNLSKPEYKAYLTTVHAYLKRIEDEQNQRYAGMPDQPPPEELQNPSPLPGLQGADGQMEGDFNFLTSMVPKNTGVQSNNRPSDFNMSSFDSQKPRSSTAQGFGQNPSANIPQNQPTTYDANWAVSQATKPQNALKAISLAEQAEKMGGPKMETTFGFANKMSGNHLSTAEVATVTKGARHVNSWQNQNQAQNNTASKDPFQNFGGFGQQPPSQTPSQFQQWGQPAMQQSQQNAAGGWDDLDKALQTFPGLGMNPKTNPSQQQQQHISTSQQPQVSQQNNNFNTSQANPWKGPGEQVNPRNVASYGGSQQQAPVSQGGTRQASISHMPNQGTAQQRGPQQQAYGSQGGFSQSPGFNQSGGFSQSPGFNQSGGFGQSQGSNQANTGGHDTYNASNSNSNANYSGSYNDSTNDYSGNNVQESNPPEEKKPNYEGNNPLRFLNMPTGMSALRGKR